MNLFNTVKTVFLLRQVGLSWRNSWTQAREWAKYGDTPSTFDIVFRGVMVMAYIIVIALVVLWAIFQSL